MKTLLSSVRSSWTARLGFILLAVCLLAAASPARAAWTENGAPVSQPDSANQLRPVGVPDGSGGSILVWQDYRNGNADIYAQRVDADGNRLWASDVAVCYAAGNQISPKIAADGSGGAIIVWEDYRSGNGDIFAQRVTSLGTFSWNPNGLAVCTLPANQKEPVVTATSAGGAVVAWTDYRNGNSDIYAQSLSSANGSGEWGGGVGVCTLASNQIAPVMVSDDADGAIIAWLDSRNAAAGIGQQAFAQKVDASGAKSWSASGGNGVRVSALDSSIQGLAMARDYAGGAVLAWSQSSTTTGQDIIASRLDTTGLALWNSGSPVTVCQAAGNQIEVSLAVDATAAVLVWQDYRGGVYADIYGQRLALGTATEQWGAQQLAISSASGNQRVPRAILNSSSTALAAWYDFRDNATDIYYQTVTPGGATLPEDVLVKSTALAETPLAMAAPRQADLLAEMAVAIVGDGQKGAILAWQDDRNGAPNIYGQRMYGNLPLADSVIPASGPNNGVLSGIVIAGTNFAGVTQVSLTREGETPIAADSFTIDSDAQITCAFDLTGLATGVWYLSLTNGEGRTGNNDVAFTVTWPAPVVGSVTPESGGDDRPANVTISGSNFRAGATAHLAMNGQSDIPGQPLVLSDASSISCTFDVTGATRGNWSVVVVNSDGQASGQSVTFQVKDPVPAIDNVSPASALSGALISPFTLNGGNLDGITFVKIVKGATEILGVSVSATFSQVTCDLNLSGAEIGVYDVVIGGLIGDPATLSGGFIVANPAGGPTVTNLAPTPDPVTNDGTVSVAVTGTNFLGDAQVELRKDGQDPISATSVTVNSPNSITAVLDVSGAAVGDWTLWVINPDRQEDGATLTISYPPPVIGNLTPGQAANSGGVQVAITGTGLRAGATATLSKGGETDIGGTGVNVSSSTQMSCNFDLSGAAIGVWTLTVQNDDGKSGSHSFEVTWPLPSITSITPNGGATDTSVSITNLSGANFRSDTQVEFRKGASTIAATAEIMVNSSRLACQFDLTGAEAGAWDVVVINSDGQEATLSGGFAISSGVWPEITSVDVNPNPATNDQTNLVQVNGTNFVDGATVWLAKSGELDITPEPASTSYVGPTLVTCTCDLTGAAVGDWDVYIENPDGLVAVLPAGLTIEYPAPTVTGVTPAAGVVDTTVSLTVEGTFLRSGLAVRLERGGSGPIAGTITDATQLPNRVTASFDLTGAAVAADWSLVAENDDAKSGAWAGSFSVTDPPPALTTATPGLGTITDSSVTVTVTGTGFAAGISASLKKSGQGDAAATTVTRDSDTQLTLVFDLTGCPVIGPWDLYVENSDGQSDTLSGGFMVMAENSPTASAVNPANGASGASLTNVGITGTGFHDGALVRLELGGQADIEATNVTVVDPTSLTCDISLAGATGGSWNVVVENVDGQDSGATGDGLFTVDLAQGAEAGVPDADGSGFGDGNGDGVPDSEQAHVTSLETQDGENYLTVVNPSGAAVTATAEAVPAYAPQDVSFPYQFVSCASLASDGQASFTVYLPLNTSINGWWLKRYDSDLLERISSAAITHGPAGAPSKTVISFTVLDNGDYDLDAVLGSVEYLGAPGIAPEAASRFAVGALLPLLLE